MNKKEAVKKLSEYFQVPEDEITERWLAVQFYWYLTASTNRIEDLTKKYTEFKTNADNALAGIPAIVDGKLYNVNETKTQMVIRLQEEVADKAIEIQSLKDRLSELENPIGVEELSPSFYSSIHDCIICVGPRIESYRSIECEKCNMTWLKHPGSIPNQTQKVPSRGLQK